METTRLFRVENYLIGEVIGRGEFASVHVAYTGKTAEPLAARFLNKRKLQRSAQSEQILFNEKCIGPLLVHPHILRTIDCFETRAAIVQISKLYVKEDLSSLIIDQSRESFLTKLRILDELLSSIYYLHSNHIAHRDIKIENILLTARKHVKLCDFGFATITFNGMVKSLCGSLPYLPPESLKGHVYNAFQADMWAFGIVCYQLFSGQLPYKNVTKTYDFSHPIDWSPIPIEVRPFIMSLLSKSPELRPTALEASQSPIFDILLKSGHRAPYTSSLNSAIDIECPIRSPSDRIVQRLSLLFDVNTNKIYEEVTSQEQNMYRTIYNLFQVHFSLFSNNFANSTLPDNHSNNMLITQSCPSDISEFQSSKSLLFNATPYEVSKEITKFLDSVNGCMSTPATFDRNIVVNRPDDDTKLGFDIIDQPETNSCFLFIEKLSPTDDVSEPLLDHLIKALPPSIIA